MDDKSQELEQELHKLKRLNEYMRGQLEWFNQHAWNADEAVRVHKSALEGLIELEKEIEKELKDELELKTLLEELEGR